MAWMNNYIPDETTDVIIRVNYSGPGARPTKHISIELDIRWKFRML